MRKLKQVNIFGHWYKIKFVPQDELPGNAVGLCRFPERVILVSKELRGEMLNLVLWHEFWHAKQFETGDTQILHGQVQEKHCEQFASFISSLKKQKVL